MYYRKKKGRYILILSISDLGVRGCAENLGIGYSTLTKWLKDFRESGDIPVRGSGNYASDEQKEIARLRRELRDAKMHLMC